MPVTLSQLERVFYQFTKGIDKKFEKIDARFEEMDARFDAIDLRFKKIDMRFDAMDLRFREIDAKFKKVDARFEDIDNRFKVMGGWFQAAQSIHALYTDKAITASEERLTKKMDNILSVIDGFLKRTEENKQEIGFLGHQHDDLAKYCTEKIAYPAYGRKL
mgnify:CR=1 FL=1